MKEGKKRVQLRDKGYTKKELFLCIEKELEMGVTISHACACVAEERGLDKDTVRMMHYRYKKFGGQRDHRKRLDERTEFLLIECIRDSIRENRPLNDMEIIEFVYNQEPQVSRQAKFAWLRRFKKKHNKLFQL